MKSMQGTTFGSIVEIAKGKKHNLTDAPSANTKRLIGIDDLRNDSFIRYTDDSEGVEANSNDILIAWDGANAGTIGYGKSGFIGSTIARLRLNESKYYTPFLGLFLQSKFDYLRKTATGATIPHISRKALEGIVLPNSGYEDQKRIAYLLGKVEGMIARRKEHIKQLDELLKSVFLEMFGDPVRNEKGWEKPELGNFGKIFTGNTPPRNDPANYAPGVVEWIKTDNIPPDSAIITGAEEMLSEKGMQRGRIVTKGALLVSCIAGSVESIGRAALTDRMVAFNQQINAIQPDHDVNSLFLYSLFKISKKYIQSHATKGMKNILNKGDFTKIKMIKPPANLQNQFADIVNKIELLKSRYQGSLTNVENLYGVLSQKAFKGELDLSRVVLLEEVEESSSEAVQTVGTGNIEMGLILTGTGSVLAQFTINDLTSYLSTQKGKKLTFDQLFDSLPKKDDVKFPSRKELQEMVIELLEKNNSAITQIYDYPTEKNDQVSSKQILFKVKR
ncbi:MAG TPA: restriction endonuclease subunit S [Chitinispirillaceae bacterium]|nr:restriction endonuclease subunit S [Chitinispirillaceae bacterium]